MSLPTRKRIRFLFRILIVEILSPPPRSQTTMSSAYTCLRCLSRQSHAGKLSIRGQHCHSKLSQRLYQPSYGFLSKLQRSNLHTTRPRQVQVVYDMRLPDDEETRERPPPVLQAHDLLHSYTNSPLPEIRKRAAFLRHHAYCPHPSHHQTRLVTSPGDFEARKVAGQTTQPAAHVRFECPDCKIPVYCCEEHWQDDYEMHLEVCDTLKQINEDDHDLRSGRFFYEFKYPGPHKVDEALINLSNWDVLLYTREFDAMDDPQRLRQATALLTYPLTIGSILHELSPYSLRNDGRLTTEGLKSLTGESSYLMLDYKIDQSSITLLTSSCS